MRANRSVDAYDRDTAVAKLIHGMHAVNVDVSLLVDDLRFTLGEWVNVIGYVEQQDGEGWIVRAVMVWATSPGFNLVQYENVVGLRMQS